MMLKRIAAIGDIHAEDELLDKAINFCRPQVEQIVSVGDIVDGSGDVNRCVALLRASGPNPLTLALTFAWQPTKMLMSQASRKCPDFIDAANRQ